MEGTTFPLAPTQFLTTIPIKNARTRAYENSLKHYEINKKRAN